MSTDPKTTMEMLEKFLNTPFKSPCPASDSEAWPENVQSGDNVGWGNIVRENHTSAIVRFAGGSNEPAHHLTVGNLVQLWELDHTDNVGNLVQLWESDHT
ncbi:hypothetical protein Tco_0481410 [Tanacetum coccineum]